jgi:hypothetical protein
MSGYRFVTSDFTGHDSNSNRINDYMRLNRQHTARRVTEYKLIGQTSAAIPDYYTNVPNNTNASDYNQHADDESRSTLTSIRDCVELEANLQPNCPVRLQSGFINCQHVSKYSRI